MKANNSFEIGFQATYLRGHTYWFFNLRGKNSNTHSAVQVQENETTLGL